uniref:Interleukin-7 n=1 Tax=Cyanistes caeruleus TaxID=156563 RepID=A0A8C0UMX4_CYACU
MGREICLKRLQKTCREGFVADLSHVVATFFRSTLPVLPLLLVLSPVNASSCAMGNKTEIRVKYENILSHDINELVNMSAENPDRCCTNEKREKVFFCNDTEEIESLQSMACNMLRFLNKQRISKAFRWKAAFVSCWTLQVLQCKCERPKTAKVSCTNLYCSADW